MSRLRKIFNIFAVFIIIAGSGLIYYKYQKDQALSAPQRTIVPLATYTVNLGGNNSGVYILAEVAIDVPTKDASWFSTQADGTQQMIITSNIINRVFLSTSPLQANNPSLVAKEIKVDLNKVFGNGTVSAVFFPVYEMQ